MKYEQDEAGKPLRYELAIELELARRKAERLQARHDRMLIGGVHASAKAIRKLKRKDDLNREYRYHAEALFKKLGVENMELDDQARLMRSAFNNARTDLGLIRREHTAEQCGGKCKYHKSPQS